VDAGIAGRADGRRERGELVEVRRLEVAPNQAAKISHPHGHRQNRLHQADLHEITSLRELRI
jgi:hypothetical protein